MRPKAAIDKARAVAAAAAAIMVSMVLQGCGDGPTIDFLESADCGSDCVVDASCEYIGPAGGSFTAESSGCSHEYTEVWQLKHVGLACNKALNEWKVDKIKLVFCQAARGEISVDVMRRTFDPTAVVPDSEPEAVVPPGRRLRGALGEGDGADGLLEDDVAGWRRGLAEAVLLSIW